MPPRPDVDFDFNLPHGLDDDATGEQQEPHAQSFNNDLFSQNDNPLDDTHQPMELDQDHNQGGQNSVHDDMNYNGLEEGFSDDDDAPKAFDRSWTTHQARRSSLKSKKSPRTDDGDDEPSPRTKKPRQSLFGGLVEEVEEDHFDDLFEEQPDDCLVDEEVDLPETEMPRQSIGNRMSSLNLDQQEREVSPFEQQFNLGFEQPGDSDREGMSSRGSPAPSDGEVVIPPDTQPAYGLRQGIDRKKTYTYVDQDASGNFDPAQETQNKALKLKQAKAAKAAKAANRFKKGKQRATQENIMKCIVRLRFENFGNVRNVTNEEDNWPEEWSDINSDAERELQEYRDFFRRRTPDRIMQQPIEDPRAEVDDLTGHPAARGCTSCRNNETSCSLVAGGTYPCDECFDMAQECEPIISPTEKGRCKQCVEDRNERCSFEDEPRQAICDNCADNEYICEALPPLGYRAERIIIDDIIYTENRPHIQCTHCRLEKKRCSLKKKTDKPPCKRCKKNHIGCTFQDIPKVVKEKKKKLLGPTEGDAPEVAVPDHDYFTKEDLEDLYGEDVPMFSRSPSPELEMEDEVGRKGKLTTIKTCFAHPIQFGGQKDTSDCNFCEIPNFGFTGLFEKEVHVIQWHNGMGYTEVGGGHAENSNGGRVQIVACGGHEIQHIFPIGMTPDFDQTAADLLESAETPAGCQQQLQRWCSMCFTPATFTCSTRQTSLFDQEIEGCGLKLCIGCQVRLTQKFDNDSSLMAETLDLEPKASADEDMDPENSMVVRADVGFLCQEGLLMRSLGHEAEESEL
ncbi:uncharacterized protein J4E78_009225 [Alternaria triticimaculans]|uniref:uncharacterized protein n=1 Tax=Alternaria triticimaculans TaxID=297637 RepID=UPI0020C55690|nr:uncharacterized protein J4E78_009225 [Alternaria triticimaculans]KAI4646303.1 hypothetical protein J4E78_009225 [Alternaria triticimaculans]